MTRSFQRIALLIGFYSQFGQILTFREILAMAHGSEPVIAGVLCSWLLWGAVGAALGGKYGQRYADPDRILGPARFFHPANLIHWILIILGPVLTIQLLIIRLVDWWPQAAPGLIPTLETILTAIVLGAGPLSLLCGFCLGLIVRHSPGPAFARLYRSEALGAMLGGLATGLILAPMGHPIRTALILGLAVLITGRLALGTGYGLPKSLRRAAWIVLLILLPALMPLDRWSEEIHWSCKLPGFELIRVTETRHGRLTQVASTRFQQESIFQNSVPLGNLSAPGIGHRKTDHRARALAAVTMAQHPAPKKVLLIGGALSGLPEAMLEHGPERLDAAELDPAILDLAQAAGRIPGDDPRLALHPMEGRSLVHRAEPDSWDMVVISVPEPDSTAVNRHLTREFFSELKKTLTEGGVVVVFLPARGASPQYLGPSLARRTSSVLRAMDEVFVETRAAPIGGHMLVGALSPDVTGFDPDRLAARLIERPKARPYQLFFKNEREVLEPLASNKLPMYYETLFGGVLARQASFVEEQIHQPILDHFEKTLREAPAESNTDTRPITVMYSLSLNDSSDEGDDVVENRSLLVRLVGTSGPIHAAAGPVLFFLFNIVLLFVMASREKSENSQWSEGRLAYFVLLAAGVTGAFAMTGFLTLVFMYQNMGGHVYVEIAVLTALFMAGLAGGALVADRLPREPAKGLGLLLWSMMLICLASPTLIRIVFAGNYGGWWKVITGVFIILVGAVDGATFPLLSAFARRQSDRAFGTWIYAADLTGAALAALLTTTILIPVFGVNWALWFMALLSASALVHLAPKRSALKTANRKDEDFRRMT